MYRTCGYPGCDIMFDRCDIHHVIEWLRHGTTDLDNLLPLVLETPPSGPRGTLATDTRQTPGDHDPPTRRHPTLPRHHASTAPATPRHRRTPTPANVNRATDTTTPETTDDRRHAAAGPPAHGRARSVRSPAAMPARRPSPATSRSSRRCRRSTGSRCAAATRPASTSSSGITASISTTRRSPRRSARRNADPLFQCGTVVSPGTCSRSSTRRRPRSVSSATTRACCAPRSPPTSCCAWPVRPAARARGARPHPLGERRHHQRTELPPGEQRRARVAGRTAPTSSRALNGDVDNHADLKRRARPAHRRADHHRREGDPRARVPPRSAAGDDVVEAFRRTVAEFEGSVAIGAASRPTAPISAARPPRQRPGRCTSASPRTGHRRQRAVRRGRGDQRSTCASTARRRRSEHRASLDADARPASSTVSGACATTARRCP